MSLTEGGAKANQVSLAADWGIVSGLVRGVVGTTHAYSKGGIPGVLAHFAGVAVSSPTEQQASQPTPAPSIIKQNPNKRRVGSDAPPVNRPRR